MDSILYFAVLPEQLFFRLSYVAETYQHICPIDRRVHGLEQCLKRTE